MDDTTRDLVVETVREHADSLLRVARRYAGSPADAEDAYQRALEIFVKNAARLEPDRVHFWLHTVVKHESMEVRRQRARLVGVESEGALDVLDDGRWKPTTEERSERFEELTRAAEALRRCKPAEATALVLKAQGLSYDEIAERQGWTYTKVNRCLAEGRKAFLARFEGIEAGEECERWAGVLSAMADGEASARDVLELRPHLRNCAGCRATLAEMRRAPARAAALLPAPLPAAPTLLDRLGDLVLGAQERLVAPFVKAQSALEATGAGKVAAVAASTVALAGGGVAVQGTSAGEPERPDRSAAAAASTTAAAAPAGAPATATAGEPAPPVPERTAPPARAEDPPAPGAEFDLTGPAAGGGTEPGVPTDGAASPETTAPRQEPDPAALSPRDPAPERESAGEFAFE